MKILHLIYTFEVGGAETMLVDIINGQISRGNDVTLLVINKGINPKLSAKLDRRTHICAMNRRQGSAPLLMMLKLNLFIARLRPDIIHGHHHKFGRLVRLRRSRLLITIHDVNEPMIYCGCSRMVAITDAVEADIRSRVPDASVRTIYNGIRTSDIATRPAAGHHTPFRIVQVARLITAKKGQDILIRAVALLNERGISDIDVTFIGDGPDTAMLTMMAQEQGVADRIHFKGLCSREYIYHTLADYDAMIHPSRYEGFGLTIAEAMAAALPLAVTAGDGPWEVADHGRLCESFGLNDVAACADAIARLKDNYTVATERAVQARTYAIENFDISHTVENYLAYYDELI